MKPQNVRTLSLIVCTLTYLFVGAAVFDALESDHELKTRKMSKAAKDKVQAQYNISNGDLAVLEDAIMKSIPHKGGYQWKYTGALYFATTVITTVGYGHSTPMTIGGKMFCIFYALAGIPLGLVCFQSIGERVNTIAAKIIRMIKGWCGRDQKVTQYDLLCVSGGLGSFLTFFGAFVFSNNEGWSYFDSVYYCFTTLTTIGFGDFVALQQHGALQSRPRYVIFSIVFILFGLTVISAAMNLLVLRFLTMNTADEKRDQREAMLAARGLVRIRKSSRESDEETSIVHRDDVSTVSCSCHAGGRESSHRSSVRQRPFSFKRQPSSARQRLAFHSSTVPPTPSFTAPP